MKNNSRLAALRSVRSDVAERVSRASESRSTFHARVLDAVRKFLKDHAMAGKTGAREFYEFERDLHAKLMEVERRRHWCARWWRAFDEVELAVHS